MSQSKKNIIIVTGGAGFVGSNLIEFLSKKTKKKLSALITIPLARNKITLNIKESVI